jgi:multidrug efflux system membrane fusion protein
VLALAVALPAGGGAISSCSKPSGDPPSAAGKSRAVPVTVAEAVKRPVPLELSTFGTARAAASVAVRSQVDELLKEIHFEKGQKIARGDLLFTIESKPFEIAVQQAQAALARDKSQAANSKLEAERAQELYKKQIVSQAESDTAAASAEVLAQTVKVAEAALANARLQVDHCRIYSPIDGRAGNIMVTAGNLVKANDVPLVVINQISPIDIFFALPQAELDRVRGHMVQGELAVEAILPDDPDHPEKGRLTFIDNAVNTSTGTIQVGASFPNAAERLWPGRYVGVRLRLMVQQDAVVVPARAVGTGSNGQFVFVVKPDRSVEQRSVQVARTYGDDVVIGAGVNAGEQVVTDGQLQLEDGTKVEIGTGQAKDAQPAATVPASTGAAQ